MNIGNGHSGEEREQHFDLLQLWLASVFADLKGLGELYGSAFFGAIPFDEAMTEAVRLATLTPDPALAQPCLAGGYVGGQRDFGYMGFAASGSTFVVLRSSRGGRVLST
jgi:hypothetical protein